MRLQLQSSQQIHTIRGGYYFLNDMNMLYWFPNQGNKQLLMIYCPESDWAKVREER